ncbi:MAG: hypothetical protein Q7R76_07150 [Candidatus Woesearchaeota archaeon]|nr:hypothetical protein [Candidatus Woesearchaeota archaeon]
MRWTPFFSCVLIMVLLAGCYNTGSSDEKTTQGEELQKEDQKDAGAIGEQGLSDILDEAESDAEPGEARPEESAKSPEGQPTGEAKAELAETQKQRIQKEVTSDLTVLEGGVVELKLKAYDPDGDKLTYTYGKPLDQNGRWQTKVGDEGVYKIDVTVSDGKTKTVKTITVRVTHKNRSPTIEPLQKIVVNEGDTVNLAPRVKDSEGANVQLTFSGWMTEPRKTTGFDDAGNYRVTITASDGELQATTAVDIEVKDVNRAPVFEAVIG